MLLEFVRDPVIAYFSMEIALDNDIPTYSGGLGVLAGDTLRSATDLDLPMVGITLVSRKGYFKQEINDNNEQVEHPEPWEPQNFGQFLPSKIAVEIKGRQVWVGAWLYVLENNLGSRKPVILLDTDLPENHPDDRRITDCLYGDELEYRLRQEIILGIGGVRLLHALDFAVREYHMNEGHSALLGVELIRRNARVARLIKGDESQYDLPYVRSICKFTTHTPVKSGHDKYPYDMVEQTLGHLIDIKLLKQLASEDCLNMTQLALNLSEYVNGVAKRHAEVSNKMFPGYHIRSITNGVHPLTWTCESFVSLYDNYLPGWRFESDLLGRVDQIPDIKIWQAHQQAKNNLLALINDSAGVQFDPDIPIIGFARRMTAYKRPNLLFSDMALLSKIAEKLPFQLVISGKAHPKDLEGKQGLKNIKMTMQKYQDIIPSVYLPNYDLNIAKHMVSGVDIWLNTPLRPLEASGTSGMKASFNGVPNFSVLDGWWIEGCIEGVTGWSIGDSESSHNGGDQDSLYEKLENIILPLYHNDRNAWVKVMKGAIAKNASYFNSHRMMRRYVTEAYLR